jgi:hypothetical protein
MLFIILVIFMIPVHSVTNLTIDTETEDDNPPYDQSNSPVSDFIVSPDQPIIWDIITFTDISTDLDNDIIARTWNIDGHVHNTVVVQCAFLKPGNYSAILLVMDLDGNTDAIEKQITIYDAPIDNNSDDPGDDNRSDIVPPAGFNWWFVVVPVLIIIIVVIGVIIWKKEYFIRS